MKTDQNPLTQSHFRVMCVTGGRQPYAALQETMQTEQLRGVGTQFLDAPTFTSSGHCFFYGQEDGPVVLEGMVFLEGR